MKVLHLSTTDLRGGAGRSAFHIHRGLLEVGVDSTMLVHDRASDLASVITAPPPPEPEGAWRFIRKVHFDANRSKLSSTYFSFDLPGADISTHPAVRSADVLHLHWLAGWLPPATLAPLLALGKRVVWTMHDQRPFTGGCHFSAGCEKFASNCKGCPQLRDDFGGLPARQFADVCGLHAAFEMTLVSPSRWLATTARRNPALASRDIRVIPYGVDTAAFYPSEKAAARAALGISPDAQVVIFGAESAVEKRKGAAELREVIRALQPGPTFAAFGHGLEFFDGLGVHALGFLDSPEKLRLAYTAADIFVLPSLEDNLPNTMLESLACGTPVVAFAAGGIPDMVEDSTPVGDTAALANAIRKLLADPALLRSRATAAVEKIAAQHTLAIAGERYHELYESISPLPQSPNFRPACQLRRSLLPLWYSAFRRRGIRNFLREAFST